MFDPDEMNFRPTEIASPVITLHAPLLGSIERHMNFENLTLDSDGVINISYTHKDSIAWNGDIGIPDIAHEWQLPYASIGGDINVTPPPFPVHLKSSLKEGVTNSYVSVAELTSGEVSFTLSGAGSLTGNILITIPELTRNGNVFMQTISLSSAASNSYPLAGYKITPDSDHELNVQFAINASGTGSGTLDVDFGISGMDVNYLSGYFGQISSTQDGEMDFNFFDELDFDGMVGFKDITMTAAVTNHIGIPMSVKADVSFVNEGIPDDPLGLDPPFGFSVDGATESGSNHTVSPATESFSTKLTDALELGGDKGYPSKLKFNIEGKINPDGKTENFIVKNSGGNLLLNTEFTFNVPLHIKISEYARRDTIEFAYNDITGDSDTNDDLSKSIEAAIVILNVNNGLPFDIALSVSAIDGAGNLIETILPRTDVGEDLIKISLDKDQIEKLRTGNVKNLILYASAKTANEDYVKITKDAFIDIVVLIERLKSDIPANF
jgi:hypothetical protein